MIEEYFVCTPGKTGTSTIEKTLITHKKKLQKATHDLKNMEKKIKEGKKTLFIVGVRNPIERNFSNFIAGILSVNNQRKKHPLKEYLYNGPPIGIVKKMTKKQLNDLFYKQTFHNFLIDWFEIFFNIIEKEIENISFPKDEGFCLYDMKCGSKLFLFSLEKLNENKLKICEILDCKKLINTNVLPKNKTYYDIKSKISYSEDYKRNMLDNKIVNFFYTKEYIEKIKKDS